MLIQSHQETLEDEYCLSCECYEELYCAYSQLAVLMDALHVRCIS